jgi:hypothetical protein
LVLHTNLETIIMKKNLLLFIVLFTVQLSLAQTKTTSTTKKTSTTTSIKPKTSTTAKKTSTTSTTTKTSTAPKPAESTTTKTTTIAAPNTTPNTTEQGTSPTEVKTAAVPPATGPITSGPKSYDNEKTNKKPSTKTAKVAKTPKAKSTTNWAKNYFGLRGGYNLNTLSGIEDVGGSDAQTVLQPGIMAGLFFSFGIGTNFALQPELNYMPIGAKIKSKTIDAYSASNQNKADALLLLKAHFGAENFKFFLNAGPYIGYRIDITSETKLAGAINKETLELRTDYDSFGIKDNILDFGAVGGAGILYKLGKPVLSLEGRYQYGFADPQLYKNGIPAELEKKGHTRSLTATIGLMFPLGK